MDHAAASRAAAVLISLAATPSTEHAVEAHWARAYTMPSAGAWPDAAPTQAFVQKKKWYCQNFQSALMLASRRVVWT